MAAFRLIRPTIAAPLSAPSVGLISAAPSGKLAPDGGVPPYPAYNRNPIKRTARRPDKRSAIRQIAPDGGVPPYPAYNRNPVKRTAHRPDKRSAIRQIAPDGGRVIFLPCLLRQPRRRRD
ncbi:putative exported protein [Citrobacter rodentium ICC168]|uniref:Exported protein n=1 Tax=Citrobacter rodentium (strain ICC168) TaxID=637910 RepID=D2TU78_CITRI|nr:putative exported protein [Citrobacter rodentium ICC168]